MPPAHDLLARIQRLRQLFLADDRGSTALPDYWRNAADLRAYDQVLAARIGWKWDAALAECRDRGMARHDDARVLDFGCGSGIAARRFVAHFGAKEVLLHDRSAVAMQVATQELAAAAPTVSVRALPEIGTVAPDVLLVSHVLGELDEAGSAQLRTLIGRSQLVVIVEPGNHPASQRLSELRDQLLPRFAVLAPCPHAERCPARGRSDDWCHFFATPPPEVFTTGSWVLTARELGIDLRALPYSFLALTQTRAGADEAADTRPAHHRVLGRPKVGKHEAWLQVCTPGKLDTVTVAKRGNGDLWRQLRKRPETVRSVPPAP